MIPGMPISSYRKYTILFDVIGLILFLTITICGVCAFTFNIPESNEYKAIWILSLSSAGLIFYTFVLIYQISKCRAERNQYLPLQ